MSDEQLPGPHPVPAYPGPSPVSGMHAVGLPYGSPAGGPHPTTPAVAPYVATLPGAAGPVHGPGVWAAPQHGPGPLASWGVRLLALVVDGLPRLAVYTATGIFAAVTAVPAVDAYGRPTTEPSDLAVILFMLAFVLDVVFTTWNRFVRQGRTGQSIGKQALGIRLVAISTGRPVGGWVAFGRDIAHALDSYSFYIGWLWPLWDAKNQTFADKICSTVVVRPERLHT